MYVHAYVSQVVQNFTYLGALFGVEQNVKGLEVSVPGVVLVEVREAVCHVVDQVSRELIRAIKSKQRAYVYVCVYI